MVIPKPPDELVEQYRALPFPSDHLGDCDVNHAKPEILQQLGVHANDEVVGQLLIDVLTAPEEYDLARVEAAKIVGINVDASSALEHRLKQCLWGIVGDTREDELVRQHASQGIEAGFGGEDELQIVERILFDEEDDDSVRHGVFEYLSTAIDIDFVNRIVPRLREHSYWSKFESSIPPVRPS